MNDKILIAMPAYNEGKVIYDVIKSIKKEGFKEILVVNDCSTDNTSKEAKKAGAVVLSHVINRGAGAATYTAIKFARKNKYDFLVLLDSDGQHSPKDIKKLLKYSSISQTDKVSESLGIVSKKNSLKFDVVIGSRMIGDKLEMPIQRKIANYVGSLLTWFFFGLFVKDSQSGFKVLNNKALSKINLTFDKYEFSSEIIGEIYKNKLSFKEVPIKVIYTDHSKSKGQSIGNGFRMIFRFIKKNRFWEFSDSR